MALERFGDLPGRGASGGWTVRTRVLSAMLAFMVAGLAITGVLTFAAQFQRLEDEIRADLRQEYEELALVADDTREDGTPVHTSVDSVLRAATQSAVSAENESVITLIDGVPRYQPTNQAFELVSGQDAASRQALDQILAVHEPGQAPLVETSIGGSELVMLVASVQVPGDPSEGIFVVAIDAGAQRAAIWSSALTFTVVALVTVVLAGVMGSLVTGRLLRPLGDLRRATEEITVEDLAYRVPIPEGKDDIAGLARNFNRMLERIRTGFAEQRRFMSDVGHELRTPLTIVRGTLEMTDEEDAADVRESHRIADEELERMGRVVGDLSELAASSRPDYVRLRPVDLAVFARSALARIEHVGEREWVLTATTDAVVDADEQRLAQAVVQLAANAVRYSDAGSRIGFGVDRVLGPDGPEIHIGMQDEGVGIAPADQHRIFERFTRAEGARGGGTGLGLPIVQAIAEGHGGTVRLLSEPGRGSTFTLVLPQRAAGAESQDTPGAAAGAAAARPRVDHGQDRAGEDSETRAATRGSSRA